jgi:hypothetical protein
MEPESTEEDVYQKRHSKGTWRNNLPSQSGTNKNIHFFVMIDIEGRMIGRIVGICCK